MHYRRKPATVFSNCDSSVRNLFSQSGLDIVVSFSGLILLSLGGGSKYTSSGHIVEQLGLLDAATRVNQLRKIDG